MRGKVDSENHVPFWAGPSARLLGHCHRVVTARITLDLLGLNEVLLNLVMPGSTLRGWSDLSPPRAASSHACIINITPVHISRRCLWKSLP